MSPTDAGFYYAENVNTPMHVGSVAVFDGPVPSYGDLVRLLLAKIPRVPRYRQRVRGVPLQIGLPVWVDDDHFQILYHVRHTAVPRPGGAEQLRNLAGRVLAQRLDMSKPLWESWLVEGLEDGRWALISKVHHCMVDGIAGNDLMQLIFDIHPDAAQPEPAADWNPPPAPSTASIVLGGLQDAVAHPLRQVTAAADLATVTAASRGLWRAGAALREGLPALARQALAPTARSLNGPIGPHRRWVWTETSLAEVKRIRSALGGTVNDVVLTAITHGFRALLSRRGELSDGLMVRSMVPVSVRRADERGTLNNQVTAVFVDLPVTEPDPRVRLESVRRQMDAYKQVVNAMDVRSIIAMGDFVAPTLLALGARAGARAGQQWTQTVTTNVPGPPVPLYLLGRRMRFLYPYVPIAAGTRVTIGIYSYQGAMTFGINADFDAFPDVEVLAGGIGQGVAELAEVAAGPRPGNSAAGNGTPGGLAHSGEPGVAGDEPGSMTGRAEDGGAGPGTLTVAVTGPTGTFGSGLIPLLQHDPRVGKIIGIARRPFDPGARGWTKMEYRQGDVRDPAALSAAFGGADVVVHLAFMITGAAPPATIRAINIDGTLNTFRAAAGAGARRFVYASSVAAYGFHPDNPIGMPETWPTRPAARLFYAQEKAELEHRLDEEQQRHPSVAVYRLRPPIVVGPHAIGAKTVLPAIPGLPRLTIDPGRLPRPPVPVPVLVPKFPLQLIHEDDVGRALLLCSVAAGPPGAYNIAGDGVLTAADIARELGFLPIPVPAGLTQAAAAAAASVPFLPPAAEWVEAASHPAIMDTTKAKTELGWRPRYTGLGALRSTLRR